MHYFTCKIQMDNAAFEDPDALRNLLVNIADRVEFSGYGKEKVIDQNGNTVGEWEICGEKE